MPLANSNPARDLADIESVADPRDIVDIEGMRREPARGESEASASTKRWLGVFFRCCHVYGRMYRREAESRYVGHCPRCLAEVSARVGEGGTSRRFFFAE